MQQAHNLFLKGHIFLGFQFYCTSIQDGRNMKQTWIKDPSCGSKLYLHPLSSFFTAPHSLVLSESGVLLAYWFCACSTMQFTFGFVKCLKI